MSKLTMKNFCTHNRQFAVTIFALLSFFVSIAQQPDFRKMTPAQIIHWRDSVMKATLGDVKKLNIPNSDKLDNYTDAYMHPNNIQPRDTMYSTVQIDLKISKKSEHYTEETMFQGISKHAPQYLTANVTEVIANKQSAAFRMHGGPQAAFADYISRMDNSFTTTASYQYSYHLDDCNITANGTQVNTAAFNFKFDPVANHYQCSASGGIHVSGSQSDKCYALSPFGNKNVIDTYVPFGGFASNTIDPAKPISYVGVQDASALLNHGTLLKTSYGYRISFDEEKQDGDAMVTTHLTVLIGARVAQYDAIIESFALNDNATTHQVPYEKWLPEGPVKTKATDPGNYIAFRVYLLDKKTHQKITSGPGSSFKVSYQLSSSQLPGICTNFPVRAADLSKSVNDLRFDQDYYAPSTIAKTVSETAVVSNESLGSVCFAKINCYDYAGYGKLTAKVQVADESGAMVELDAHLLNKTATEISIPMDDNNNHIADEWENKFRLDTKDAASDDDNDFSGQNNHNGDGLSLFEEYRGFMINGAQKRLSPNVKELFVINKCDNSIDEGLNVFSTASNIKIYQLKEDEIDATDRVVNMNHSEGHGGNQHALLYKFGQVKSDEDGSAEPGNMKNMKPKDCYYILIDNTKVADSKHGITPRWFTVAHETGHACAVSHHGVVTNTVATMDATLNENDRSFVDCKAYTADGKNIKGLWMDATQTNTASAGDVDCLMGYIDRINWVRFKVGDHFEFHYVPHVPEGKTFCLSPAGTGINADDYSNTGCYKHSFFGNSSTEACYGQINIKDWD